MDLAPHLLRHLKPVKYEGDGPLKGRVYEIPGWGTWPASKRIWFLREYTKDRARDPQLFEKAMQIVRKARVEPRDYQWGRSAYLRDPDGRLVELAQTESGSAGPVR